MEHHPTNVWERLFAVLVMLFALTLFSFFVSSVTNLMIQLQALRRERTKKQQALQGYLRHNNISVALSVRAKKYTAIFIQGQMEMTRRKEDEQALMQVLPENLMKDLRDEARGPLIAAHQFFCDLRGEHVPFVKLLCHEALTQVVVHPGEAVFNTGDACTRMLFMETGLLRYTFRRTRKCKPSAFSLDVETGSCPGEAVEKIASKGQWLTEAALWTRWENCGDLFVVTPASFLAMGTNELASAAQEHERALVDVANYAQRYVKNLNHDVRLYTDIVDQGVLASISLFPGGLRRSNSMQSITSSMFRHFR